MDRRSGKYICIITFKHYTIMTVFSPPTLTQLTHQLLSQPTWLQHTRGKRDWCTTNKSNHTFQRGNERTQASNNVENCLNILTIIFIVLINLEPRPLFTRGPGLHALEHQSNKSSPYRFQLIYYFQRELPNLQLNTVLKFQLKKIKQTNHCASVSHHVTRK